MDFITETSPVRLIVLDYVDHTARSMFGDKYDYRASVSTHDPLENITKLGKPIWNTILGEEASEVFDNGGTLQNEVLLNGHIIAMVMSNGIEDTQEFLADIEQFKLKLVGQDAEHKGHWIQGNYKTKEYPAFSSNHDIDYTFGTILRVQFALVLRIYNDK